MYKSIPATIFSLLLILSLFLFLTGCGEDPPIPSLEITNKSGLTTTLNGRWAADCRVIDSEWEKTTYAFANTDLYLYTDKWLTTTSCGGGVELEIRAQGTVALGEEVVAAFGSNNVNATRMKITWESLTATPKTSAVAYLLNRLASYGYLDWTEGKAQDILLVDLDGNEEDKTLRNDLMMIDDGVSPIKMYLGDQGTIGRDGYPSQMDVSSAYEAQ